MMAKPAAHIRCLSSASNGSPMQTDRARSGPGPASEGFGALRKGGLDGLLHLVERAA
jgi:hypothetical protein